MQQEQFQLHSAIEDAHWWFVARRRIMRRLVHRVLPPSLQTTIVDVGCGTGANIAALAGEYRCLGIDTSREAISLAAARFPGVEFRAGRAPEDLGLWMEQARLVMMMDVLEHVPDDHAFLSEMLSAASPGAFFLLTVPADPELWSEHDESFGHYRRYDIKRFARLWQGMPVETHLLSYFNSRLYPLVKFIRRRNRRRGRASGTAGTDFNIPSAWKNWILTRIFAGEAATLARLLDGAGKPPKHGGYSAGVSLVALLRREPGPVPVRPETADATNKVAARGN
jgi:SAM-dependent methyltransferase